MLSKCSFPSFFPPFSPLPCSVFLSPPLHLGAACSLFRSPRRPRQPVCAVSQIPARPAAGAVSGPEQSPSPSPCPWSRHGCLAASRLPRAVRLPGSHVHHQAQGLRYVHLCWVRAGTSSGFNTGLLLIKVFFKSELQNNCSVRAKVRCAVCDG